MGLALSKHAQQLNRVGHDINPEHANLAKGLGAIDKVEYNLPASVDKADIVLLALPLDQIKNTMEIISPDLREGVVVMDTAPVKQIVAKWMKSFLGPGRYYVGLSPVVGSQYLFDSTAGGTGARKDMFQDTTMGIVTPFGTSSAAIKLASDFISLLGAKPTYFDLIELDSLMAAVHLLPQILASSLSLLTIGQPGWMEGRKLAGALFSQTSSAVTIGDTPAALVRAIQSNPEPMTRLLDALIEQLSEVRAAVYEEPTDLAEKIKTTQSDRGLWFVQRISGDWQDLQPKPEVPTAKEELRRRLFGWREKKS